MTDVETKLRDGLIALAEDICPVAPDLRSLSIEAAPRRRRRLAMAGLVVGSVALAGTAAAAAGIAPPPVQAVFDEITGWNPNTHIDPATAELVATTTLDGTTIEYWSTSPGIPRCEYVRIVRDGERENGMKACNDGATMPFIGDADFYATGGGGPEVVWGWYRAGRAPIGADAVVLTFEDGTKERIPVQHQGAFVAAYDQTSRFPRLVTLEAIDAKGTVLRRLDYSRDAATSNGPRDGSSLPG